MSLKSTLVDRTRIVITELLVLPEVGKREELMLVSEDLFVSRAQITRLSQYLARTCTGRQTAFNTYHITLPCAVLV